MAAPDVNLLEVPENRSSRFQRIQSVIQHFWVRWQKEYLSELQTRTNWKERQVDRAKIGAMVLVKNENAAVLNWQLGRITAIYPGRDNITRVVENLTEKEGIKHYNTYTIQEAAIADCVMRTLKEGPFKNFGSNGSFKWIAVLPEMTRSNNDTKHVTTGYKPSQVNKSNEKRILTTVYSHLKIAGPRKFRAGVMQGDSIKGAFHNEESQETANPDIYLVEKILREKGNRIFGKWLGLDDKHNTWMENTDFL
ncbi:hypothetical protein JTB14_002145 [Gonioctena quinquepunctata]|nr:hypothetical protein JTB14_002145 [Gonioctena quinquepunctata]